MRAAFLTATVATLLGAPALWPMPPAKSVTGDVNPQAPHAFALHLDSGDYVTCSLTQEGNVPPVLHLPDDAVLRTFPAADSDGRHTFAFAAENAGDYKIEITAEERPAHYELRIEAVTGLD